MQLSEYSKLFSMYMNKRIGKWGGGYAEVTDNVGSLDNN